jgi:hypothetical protein
MEEKSAQSTIKFDPIFLQVSSHMSEDFFQRRITKKRAGAG